MELSQEIGYNTPLQISFLERGDFLRNKSTAKSHCRPFSQALIAALNVILFGATDVSHMALSKCSAARHCPHFSHALMAAL